jgi:VanZ family protein
MGALIGILEYAQTFAAARQASPTDFLLNFTGVAAAMLIAIPFLRKADAGARNYDEGAESRTPALTA